MNAPPSISLILGEDWNDLVNERIIIRFHARDFLFLFVYTTSTKMKFVEKLINQFF